MIRSKILLQIEGRETGRWLLMFCLSPFLKIGIMFPFFQSSGNIPHFRQFLNILKRCFIIASPDIFNMWTLIKSWPWKVDEGRTLLFSIIEHCFARKELKRSAFLLKYVTNLFSWKICGIQRTFLLFNIVFSNVQ